MPAESADYIGNAGYFRSARGRTAACDARGGPDYTCAIPNDLSPLMLGAAIRQRIDQLAAISAQPDGLTRMFATVEQRRAASLVAGWMRESAMTAAEDAIGNVVGRYEGARPVARPCGRIAESIT